MATQLIDGVDEYALNVTDHVHAWPRSTSEWDVLSTLTRAVARSWAIATLVAHGRATGLEDCVEILGATVLVTFTAAFVAVLGRPDPHRMVTRLLASIRVLAAASALLTFSGALAFSFRPHRSHGFIGVVALLSLIPACLAMAAWIAATLKLKEHPRRSPWEQSPVLLDGHGPVAPDGEDLAEVEAMIRDQEAKEAPYDMAVRLLRFDRPAMKVASSEGARRHFILDVELLDTFDRRLAVGLAPDD